MIDYDPHSWRSHLFDIRGSMAREIILRVTLFTLWAVGVVVCYQYYPWRLNSNIHGLVGMAIGLLLVFRTNSSYDRFWEGRKLWGGIVNETRNLARLAATHLHDEPELRNRVIRWTIAFPYSAMFVLRRTSSSHGGSAGGLKLADGELAALLLGPIASHLDSQQVALVLAANHQPTAVARQISEALLEARQREFISDFVMLAIDQNSQLLIDYLGGCERIYKTPIPFAYMVHVRRSLIVYCFSLPFVIVGEFGWLSVLVTFLVSYLFIGIEEIGVEIEDPFGADDNDLPLEAICATIERNLRDIIKLAPPKPSNDIVPTMIGKNEISN